MDLAEQPWLRMKQPRVMECEYIRRESYTHKSGKVIAASRCDGQVYLHPSIDPRFDVGTYPECGAQKAILSGRA